MTPSLPWSAAIVRSLIATGTFRFQLIGLRDVGLIARLPLTRSSAFGRHVESSSPDISAH